MFSASLREQNSCGFGTCEMNSKFTEFLMEALNGAADLNKDDVVTLSEVETHVSNKLIGWNKPREPKKRQNMTVTRPGNVPSDLPLAQLKAAAAPLLSVQGELTNKDEKDTVRTTSFRKVHTVNFVKGETYTIDMKSAGVDSYLRLEDPNGKQVAFNDDVNGTSDSQIVHTATQTGVYRVVATTYRADQTGAFSLTVRKNP